MTLIETDRNPSSRERKSLALSLCAVGGVVALMVLHRPAMLLLISGVSGVAWCASMLFHRDEPRGRQWKGVLIPIVVALLYIAARNLDFRTTISGASAAVFVLLGVAVWFRERFGNGFYRTWMMLFLPIAWSVSTLLLVLVYFGVLTPIGIMMRTIGRDPLHRRFDRGRTSYWVKRNAAEDSERFFRQF